MNDQEFMKAVTRAIEEAAAMDKYDVLHAPPAEYRFSPAFRRRLNRLLRDPLGYSRVLEYPTWLRATRTAAAVFAAVLVTFGTVMAIPPARAAVIRVITFWYEEYVSIRSTGSGNALTAENNPGWRPAFIPEGYTEKVELIFPDGETISYTHASQPPIYFEYGSTDAALSYDIDTEHSTQIITTINGHEAYRFEQKTPEDFNHLVWYDTNQEYIFHMSGKVPIDVLMKVALSLTKSS